jgi:deferrochelatase/peroxidase EfeB
MPIDRQDVQGLILRGYNYSLTRLLFLSFPEEARGRSFLRWIFPRITTSELWAPGTKPEPLFNLGLSYVGLQVLGVEALLQAIDPKLVLADSPFNNPFPVEFRGPPSSRTLGDLSASDKPETWWNGTGNDAVYPRLHAGLFVYARTPSVLDAAVDEILAKVRELGMELLVTGADGLPLGGPSLSGHRVHFGHVDGTGQPDVDWDNDTPAPGKVDWRYFLLGDPTPEIRSKPDPARTKDLFRNGGYVAFRWLSQDARAFEEFLDAGAPTLAANLVPEPSPAEARELLAAKLVGRWRGGAPLTVSPDRDDPSMSEENTFKYQATDTDGLRCPFSAHVRVANPRDQKLRAIATEGVPPLLRRGLSYGPEWVPGVNDDADRGLMGLFLCSSLERQFQQIIRWMNVNDFSPVFDGKGPIPVDPLSNGVRVPGQRFLIPTPAGPVSIPMPRPFVRSRGTAYFLLPGMTTLRRIMG